MSESKFTKGPWVAYISPVELNQGYTSVECNSGVIYGEPMYKSSEIEDTANAHLIAAAPDMYELLEELEYRIDCEVGEYGYSKQLHDKLINLLAKARGEA